MYIYMCMYIHTYHIYIYICKCIYIHTSWPPSFKSSGSVGSSQCSLKYRHLEPCKVLQKAAYAEGAFLHLLHIMRVWW